MPISTIGQNGLNDTQAELISGQAETINALVTRIEALESKA